MESACDLRDIDPIGEIEADRNSDPTLFDAFDALREGNNFWRAGKPEQSVVSCQKAVNLDPMLYAAQFNLGFALLRAEEYQSAELALRQALRVRPKIRSGVAMPWLRTLLSEALRQVSRSFPAGPTLSSRAGSHQQQFRLRLFVG
jgi:tetratricopeptide (TPR) repeat protein